MWNKNAVESPDSAQPNPSQAGSCSSAALSDCAGARKVTAPVGVAAGAGEDGGAAGPVTGPAEELVEELQAVNRRATQARYAQDAICLGLCAFAVCSMMVQPFNQSINQ
jgi:hypothetical protein